MKLLFCTIGLILPIFSYAQFMTDTELNKEFSRVSKLESIFKLNPEGKKHLQNLIPTSTFFDAKSREELQKLEKVEFNPQSGEIKPEVDLRQYDTPVKSQDNGKCTAYSLMAILENKINQGKPSNPNLSDWHHWSHYKQYSCVASLKAALSNYVCDEKYYPQYGRQKLFCNMKAWAKVGGQTYIGNNATSVKIALSRNNPVYLAMTTPQEMLNCVKVISPNSAPSNGGHALAVVGFKPVENDTLLILKNSWGSRCGDKGYQYLPISLCSKSGFYCDMWEITNVTTK